MPVALLRMAMEMRGSGLVCEDPASAGDKLVVGIQGKEGITDTLGFWLIYKLGEV